MPATLVVVVVPCRQSVTLAAGGEVNTIGGDGIGGIAAGNNGGELVDNGDDRSGGDEEGGGDVSEGGCEVEDSVGGGVRGGGEGRESGGVAEGGEVGEVAAAPERWRTPDKTGYPGFQDFQVISSLCYFTNPASLQPSQSAAELLDSLPLPAATFPQQTPHTTIKSPLPATPVTVVLVVPCRQSATLAVGGGVNTTDGDGIGGIAASDGGGELVGSGCGRSGGEEVGDISGGGCEVGDLVGGGVRGRGERGEVMVLPEEVKWGEVTAAPETMEVKMLGFRGRRRTVEWGQESSQKVRQGPPTPSSHGHHTCAKR
ncbi:hypothetical protein Droror1_Dr00002446 [Drosera rotundifolia]